MKPLGSSATGRDSAIGEIKGAPSVACLPERNAGGSSGREGDGGAVGPGLTSMVLASV